jgi:sugar lactone lactonase YvrE
MTLLLILLGQTVDSAKQPVGLVDDALARLTEEGQALTEQGVAGDDAMAAQHENLPALRIVQSFVLPPHTPEVRPRGLAYGGKYLYVPTARWGIADPIFKLDPDTGTLIETFYWDVTTFPTGIAWDGRSFYLSDDQSSGIVVVDDDFDPRPAGRPAFLELPARGQRDLAFDGTDLLVATSGYVGYGGGNLDKIWSLDTRTGSIKSVMTFPRDGGGPGGLAWDGKNIWLGFVGARNRIKRIDTQGVVLGEYEAPGGGRPTGLAFDGRYLWCVTWDDKTIYQLEIPFDNPFDLLNALIDHIRSLSLHDETENSLLATLNAALLVLTDLVEPNDHTAVHILGAFIKKVEGQHGKKMPASDADALISDAQEIIELLDEAK